MRHPQFKEHCFFSASWATSQALVALLPNEQLLLAVGAGVNSFGGLKG